MIWRICCILPILFVSAHCFADDSSKESTSEVSAALSLLPDSDNSDSTLRIDAVNYEQFKTLIIPELSLLLRSGALYLNSARKLNFIWRMDDEWESNSIRSSENKSGDDGSLVANAQLKEYGFPFGSISKLEKLDSTDTFAAKLLWNSQAIWWSQHVIESLLEIDWQESAAQRLKLVARLVRIYPRAMNVEGFGTQLFRERLEVTQPVEFKGLSMLTFRFLGSERDMLWSYSPLLQKSRQLTGSNRADELFTTSLSLDDLLTWSGKQELVSPRMVNRQKAFIPFADFSMTDMHSEQGCWRFEGPRLRSKSPSRSFYVPGQLSGPENYQEISDLLFVPREVLRVDLASEDPYSSYGRQVLYVDLESQLPVIKVVFDRAGRLWKLVFSAFGLGHSSDLKRKAAYPYTTVIYDFLSEKFFRIRYKNLQFCEMPPKDLTRDYFDPGKLQAVAPSTEANSESQKDKP